MDTQTHAFVVPNMQRNIITGVLVLIPLLVTWLVFEFLFDKLAILGRPWTLAIFRVIHSLSPELANWLFMPWVEYTLAVLLTIVVLYVLGWAMTRVLGRRMLAWFEAMLERIPLVKTIYGSTKTLLSAFQGTPGGVQRVVFIEFPSPGLKTVGFITRVLVDERNGEDLAVVYVPTAPNPTSGYLEIVPLANVIETQWTVDEAMRFVITGGVSGPEIHADGGLAASARS